MVLAFKNLFSRLMGKSVPEQETLPTPSGPPLSGGDISERSIPPNDPLLAYINDNSGVIEVEKLKLDSPTLTRLREAGYKLSLPLLSQGELLGLLNLGPRMSEQDYSSEDHRLLNTLATQASPALRVAQLAQQQLIEAKELERMEQELRVARVIQETLLPKEIPTIPGWELDVFWQPAREVGGDFYDFIHLPDGRLAVLVADVTDKGVPAAMVVATSRSLLRAAAERLADPGEVLGRANELLHPDIPARMFVTCIYLVVDHRTGLIRFANAGHNLPYKRGPEGVQEIRATGMPLGLLPGMTYEEAEIQLDPGDSLLLSSDGIVEAHNPAREMYGFPRVRKKLAAAKSGESLITHLLEDLREFTGPDHEQEDDITLLTITRTGSDSPDIGDEIAFIEAPSERGTERAIALQVLEQIRHLRLPDPQLMKLQTAVSEAVMNAMEHGNDYQADKSVHIRIFTSNRSLIVQVSDHGAGAKLDQTANPDLSAKLAGEQSPRGWGLFLIKNMIDDVSFYQADGANTIEMVMNLERSQPNEPK